MKARLRDLEDKLMKLENRSYDNLGMGQRLNLRPIIEDSDNNDYASEQRNGGKSQVDTENSDPLFPANHFLLSNPGSPPRRVLSTSNEGVRLLGYALNVILPGSTIFTMYKFVYPLINSLISFYFRRAIGEIMIHLPLHM